MLYRQGGKVVAHQGTAQRAATVNDQHFACAILFESGAHEGIVLMHFERMDLSFKHTLATKVCKHGVDHLKAVYVFIAKVGCGVLHVNWEMV